ncbi:MAG: endolytic transglycosylase MltG [Thermodesulfobacterium sp.]|nr:endolytic transglycosylase MltG [Thermodesulfobacterium sp.]
MKFSRENFFKNLMILGFVFVLLTIGFYLQAFQPVSSQETKEFKIVEIKKGDSLWEIARKLKEKGVIRSKIAFILKAWIGQKHRMIKAGEYGFYTYYTLDEIIDLLVQGKVLLHKVTIPEGLTLWQIAEILEREGICAKEEFLNLAQDPEIVQKFGFSAPTLEGYLFPDTYFWAKNTHPAIVIKTMVDNFWKNWKEFETVAKSKNMTLEKVITLASIVEKEAFYDWERPIIAAVYLNRLKKGMPLQADPGINYALKKFRRLTYKDYYSVRSPYNTYLNEGLPPTPIGNPGKASIKAVLFPAKVPYLYFVSKGDGTHFFSKTYQEHLKAIERIRGQQEKFSLEENNGTPN